MGFYFYPVIIDSKNEIVGITLLSQIILGYLRINPDYKHTHADKHKQKG